MPALKLLQRILKKSPNFVFYDDNKAMIGVVRSGRNPTMRHLERSHGVCISWMHEMFSRDYMCLAYEVTERMAADIYTKAFNDGRTWKHACLQIGLLDPSLLSDPDTLKALTPTCDPIKGTMHAGWVERAVWQFHPVPVAVPAREQSPRPRPTHVGSGDVDMQSVLAAFVEELSNERIELKCVNDRNFAPVEAAYALSAYQS